MPPLSINPLMNEEADDTRRKGNIHRMTNAEFKPGQRAVISRVQIVSVDRVTPSGRVIVGDRTFNPDGYERAGGSRYHAARLEPLTPEIESEIQLVKRGAEASNAAAKAIASADAWLRRSFSVWGRHRRVPDAADVEKAERLIAAIKQAIGEETAS